MIRLLVGSALPVLSLAVAASFLGGDILSEPGGEPLIMASSSAAMLQPASFDSAPCSKTLLLADAGMDANGTGRRIIGLAVRADAGGYAIDIEDLSEKPEHRPAMVLFVDAAGQLIGAEQAPPLPASASESCVELPDPSAPGPV